MRNEQGCIETCWCDQMLTPAPTTRPRRSRRRGRRPAPRRARAAAGPAPRQLRAERGAAGVSSTSRMMRPAEDAMGIRPRIGGQADDPTVLMSGARLSRTRNSQGWPKSCKLAQPFDCESLAIRGPQLVQNVGQPCDTNSAPHLHDRRGVVGERHAPHARGVVAFALREGFGHAGVRSFGFVRHPVNFRGDYL